MIRLNRIRKITRSIAFVPSIVVFLFFLISIFMIYLDYSETGKALKSANSWIRLKDPSTARTIVSVIAAGLISLTVFSFTMVMVVLNQAASQLSNRVLDMLTGKRFHQFIIGYYIGNIVFALTLLTSVRDIESGVYVPALSTYLLILLTIIAVLLFVFFIHFITQAIKYSTIVKGVYQRTLKAMEGVCTLTENPVISRDTNGFVIKAHQNGLFETFGKDALLGILRENDLRLQFIHPVGTYFLRGAPIAKVCSGTEHLPDKVEKQVLSCVTFSTEVSVEDNYFAGFRQLSEITVKALSPGVNDTGTAVESLQQLFSLLAFRLNNHPASEHLDKDDVVRIITREMSFDEIFRETVLPVWDYGRKDRVIRSVLLHLLEQLQAIGGCEACEKLHHEMKTSQASFESS